MKSMGCLSSRKWYSTDSKIMEMQITDNHGCEGPRCRKTAHEKGEAMGAMQRSFASKGSRKDNEGKETRFLEQLMIKPHEGGVGESLTIDKN